MAASLVTGGCSGADGDGLPSGTTVRDSAGVRIVESASPQLTGERAWRLGEKPTLEIGSAHGEGGTALFRVTGAVELSDGRIAAWNAGHRQVRWFAPDGRYLGAAGREGDGPGEFRAGGSLRRLPGDSVQVYDLVQGRLTVFDPQGAVARMVSIGGVRGPGPPLYLAPAPDGSHIVFEGINPIHLEDRGSGLQRGDAWIVRMGPTGQNVRELIAFQSSEQVVARDRSLVMGTPFTRRAVMAVTGGRIILGFADRWELGYHDLDGVLRTIARRTTEPRAVTRQEMEAYETDRRERTSDPARTRRLLDEMVYPPTHPVFEDAMADLEGNVWVENHRMPREDGPARWSVFGGDGVWLTDVEVPDGLRLLEIRADRVLAVWQDDFGVEYLRRYPLIKPPAPGSSGG